MADLVFRVALVVPSGSAVCTCYRYYRWLPVPLSALITGQQMKNGLEETFIWVVSSTLVYMFGLKQVLSMCETVKC